jgi:hypothetical protein
MKLFRPALTRRSGSMGVVTGCDAGAEWMLEWWYENLRRHNVQLPVCFADFGMSRPMHAWCKRHGEVVDLRNPRGVQSGASSWFKKPMAIVKSGFEKVIWLDTDCEVLGWLGEYFAYCDVAAIGLTYDVRTNLNLAHCRGVNGNLITEPFQSGVVVARPDNELIVEWADRCARNPVARGDQEMLIALIVERIEAGNSVTRIRVMPPEYQWLRLQGTPPANARVMHWTGPAGKERIREKISAALKMVKAGN